MSLSERYRLISTTIVAGNDGNQSVEFLWAYEILKDGVVQASNNHRGAYPRGDDGTPLVDIAPTISSILSSLQDSTLLELDTLKEELLRTKQELQELKQLNS